MVQYVITPWRTHSSLLHVRSQLYQDPAQPVNNTERQHAVAKVAVWMQRGNCPHLVESTAVITAAVLNDRADVGSYCVRAAYAAAFARFVTGLLDSHQSARHKISMYTIAETINLPATFVELRHQATHEELPSLTRLRSASQKALRWIWDYYWCKLPEGDGRMEGVKSCAGAVGRVLREGSDEIREALVKDWGVDAVLRVLMSQEFLEEGEEDDPAKLLRAVELSAWLIGVDEHEAAPTLEKLSSLEEVRAELARMSEELGVAGADEANVEMSGTKDGAEEGYGTGNGWKMWEGEWVPKPIGVV